MTRRKAEKLPLPQTAEEAIGLLGRYAAIDATIEAARADAEAEIAAIRARVDAACAPLEVDLKAAFNRLKPWWAVEGDALTEGKRKSLELGGCVIGHRMTPPKVVFVPAGKTLDEVIGDWWADDNWTFLRSKDPELDKPTIMECLRGSDKYAPEEVEDLTKLGFSVRQKEEFFIDRIPPKAPAVEIVAPAAEQVPA